MKIEKNDTDLYISFSDEREGKHILRRILNNFNQQPLNHYYFYFDDSFYNFDLSEYYKSYPMLKENISIGCLEIKSEDINDITFIYSILNQYHYSWLYINSDPDFLRFYNPKVRGQRFPQNIGYIVNMEIFDDSYIHIHKSFDLPDWDLLKMELI